MSNTISAAAKGMPDIIEVIDQLNTARNLANLVLMACDGLAHKDPDKASMAAGAYATSEAIQHAICMLNKGKGGESNYVAL